MIIIGSLLSPFHYSLNHTPLASNLEAFIQLYVQLIQSIVQIICRFLASILEASKHRCTLCPSVNTSVNTVCPSVNYMSKT